MVPHKRRTCTRTGGTGVHEARRESSQYTHYNKIDNTTYSLLLTTISQTILSAVHRGRLRHSAILPLPLLGLPLEQSRSLRNRPLTLPTSRITDRYLFFHSFLKLSNVPSVTNCPPIAHKTMCWTLISFKIHPQLRQLSSQ